MHTVYVNINNKDTNNSFIPIHSFDNPIEESLRQIEDCILDAPNEIKRFYAIKLFERDEKKEVVKKKATTKKKTTKKSTTKKTTKKK